MVPPAILDSGVTEKSDLGCSAKATCSDHNSTANSRSKGHAVRRSNGYHVRFDSRYSPKTELLTLTTGLLLQRLIRDPLLETVGCVILDEFHERSIEMDLALGMIQQIRTAFRPELKT